MRMAQQDVDERYHYYEQLAAISYTEDQPAQKTEEA
jgi:hypothetical protein